MLTHVLIKFALHKPLCRRILNLIIASAEIIIVTEEQCALRRRAHAHILLAPMLTARKFLLVPMISPAVNVARIVVIMDNFVPRRPTRVHTLLVPMLMVRKFLLVPMTSTPVNVVRTVVILDKLVPRLRVLVNI